MSALECVTGLGNESANDCVSLVTCKNYEGNEDDVIPMIITNIIPMQLFTVMVAAIADMYIITIFKYVGS